MRNKRKHHQSMTLIPFKTKIIKSLTRCDYVCGPFGSPIYSNLLSLSITVIATHTSHRKCLKSRDTTPVALDVGLYVSVDALGWYLHLILIIQTQNNSQHISIIHFKINKQKITYQLVILHLQLLHHDLSNIWNTKQKQGAVELHNSNRTKVSEKNIHILDDIPLIILFSSKTTP